MNSGNGFAATCAGYFRVRITWTSIIAICNAVTITISALLRAAKLLFGAGTTRIGPFLGFGLTLVRTAAIFVLALFLAITVAVLTGSA